MNPATQPLITIVEDEPDMAQLIANYLGESGMMTQICYRAGQAMNFIQDHFTNLVLVDINLPDKSGFDLVREMRRSDIQTPVIYVTGDTLEISKIKGLELGGDDYITKPFSYPELVARIRAVLRRTEAHTDLAITRNVQATNEPFDFCGARLIPTRLEIELPDGSVQKIGRKEIGIMAYLKQNQGIVITRKALIHSVWGIHANVKSRSLDQYIAKIREMLRPGADTEDILRTIHGVGYIFEGGPKRLPPAAPPPPVHPE